MSKFEKYLIAYIIGVLIIFIISITSLFIQIDNAGGIKGIAVSIGKDIKDIKKQIDED